MGEEREDRHTKPQEILHYLSKLGAGGGEIYIENNQNS